MNQLEISKGPNSIQENGDILTNNTIGGMHYDCILTDLYLYNGQPHLHAMGMSSNTNESVRHCPRALL